MMTKLIVVVMGLFLCAGSVYAAGKCAHCPRQGSDLGTKTVGAVTGTAQSAVSGTATIAETSVGNTAAAPMTAIQAVKNTANTAFTTTDSAIKALTGEE